MTDQHDLPNDPALPDGPSEPPDLESAHAWATGGLIGREVDTPAVGIPEDVPPPVDGGTTGEGESPGAVEPPIVVGSFVRVERRGEEVPALVMQTWDDGALDLLVFSMLGPAFVRPQERVMRTPPGNGGWWPVSESIS